MKKGYEGKIQKVIDWGLGIFIFLLPLFFLPVTSEMVAINKGMLLVLFSGILIPVVILKSIMREKLEVVDSKNTLLVLLFAVFMGVSFWFSKYQSGSIYSVESWAILMGVFLFFVGAESTISKKNIAKIMMASAVLLSVSYVFRYISLTGTFFPFGKDMVLPNLFGTSHLASIYMGGVVVIGVWYGAMGVRMGKKEVGNEQKMMGMEKNKGVGIIGWIMSAVVVLAGLFISSPYTASLVNSLLGSSFSQPVVLDLTTSWRVGAESFKYFPVTGYGPGMFEEVFNRFRPLSLNLESTWTLTFFKSGSFVLEVLALYGGFAAMVLVFIIAGLVVEIIRKKEFEPLSIFAIFLAGAILLLPFSTAVWGTFFVLLGVLERKNKKVLLNFGENAEIAGFGLLFLFVAGILGGWWVAGKSWYGEYEFKKYLDMVAEGKVSEGYTQHLVKATNIHPNNAGYLIAASQANFVSARDLSNKEELTKQEGEALADLLQTSVNLGKQAVNSNPNNLNAWINLATIYRGIINVAEGATQWTLDSYNQAAQISPNNPAIRFTTGSFLYGVGAFQQAIGSFSDSIMLKPNFANAYYNLSWTYKNLELYPEAKMALERAMEFLDPNSEDYTKAAEELVELDKLIPEKGAEEVTEGTGQEATGTDGTKPTTPTAKPTSLPESNEKLEKAENVTQGGIPQLTPPITVENE